MLTTMVAQLRACTCFNGCVLVERSFKPRFITVFATNYQLQEKMSIIVSGIVAGLISGYIYKKINESSTSRGSVTVVKTSDGSVAVQLQADDKNTQAFHENVRDVLKVAQSTTPQPKQPKHSKQPKQPKAVLG